MYIFNAEECEDLETFIPQGQVRITGYPLGSIVTYKCYNGYEMFGNVQRQCLKNGWSGSKPECKRKLCPIYLDMFL